MLASSCVNWISDIKEKDKKKEDEISEIVDLNQLLRSTFSRRSETS